MHPPTFAIQFTPCLTLIQKNIMKKLVLSLFMLAALNPVAKAVRADDGIITFIPICIGDTIIGKGDNPIHHAPARPAVLPEVEQVGSALFFYPEEEGMLGFRIEDASRSIVCSDNIYLYTDEQNEYSLASLSAGGYYLIIAVAGREYEGEFTIE